jgi:hypothetical protein
LTLVQRARLRRILLEVDGTGDAERKGDQGDQHREGDRALDPRPDARDPRRGSVQSAGQEVAWTVAPHRPAALDDVDDEHDENGERDGETADEEPLHCLAPDVEAFPGHPFRDGAGRRSASRTDRRQCHQ